MNGKSLLAKACAAALLFSGVAWAAEQPGSVIDSDKLEDAKITNQQGEQLGGIERLLIDPQTGKAQFAVIGIGGFLGLGETNVAVPWESLQVSSSDGGNLEIRLNATKDKLENAPRLGAMDASQPLKPDQLQQIHSYWGSTGQQSPSSTAATPPSTQPQSQPTPGAQVGTPPEQPPLTQPESSPQPDQPGTGGQSSQQQQDNLGTPQD